MILVFVAYPVQSLFAVPFIREASISLAVHETDRGITNTYQRSYGSKWNVSHSLTSILFAISDLSYGDTFIDSYDTSVELNATRRIWRACRPFYLTRN
ncbi:hypothetical protein ECG_08612 [Echinococcus granulosus]|uniref:Expressed protein n=1 Tax=Echinococcus granulosus TaxID=6210 RepID=A0A068WL55_ECHGR|nr:hypothetical protein ECG_08612 [Echinococcus granulosus]CDS20821.1 expressed protein [Echinococcus granulosus]